MKTLYKLYCLLAFNAWAKLIYTILIFIGGLIGGEDEAGFLVKFLFIGVLGFGGLVMWGLGQQNQWRRIYLEDKYNITL